MRSFEDVVAAFTKLRKLGGSCLAVLLILAGLASVGKTQVTANLTGILENSYRSTDVEDKFSLSATDINNEHIQNYQLGFSGYAVSPNFMTYYLGGAYRRSDKINNSISTYTTNIDWYDFSGSLFNNRRYGLELFSKRTETNHVVPNNTRSMFTNLYGTEVRLYGRSIPRTRLGFRYTNTRGANTKDYDVFVTSLNMQKGEKFSFVEGMFRDEQKLYLDDSRMIRSQEILLKGTTQILDRSAKLTSEANYVGYNEFKTTRVNMRIQGTAREKDRYLALYSFNSVQNRNFQSYINTFNGDYRRYLTSNLNMVFNTRMQRTLNSSFNGNNTSDSENIGTGAEYLSVTTDSTKSFRKFGSSFIRLRNSNPGEMMPGTDGVGSLHWGRWYLNGAQLANTITGGYSYYRSATRVRYYSQLEYTLIGSIPLSRKLRIENRAVLRDTEGSGYSRNILDRVTASLQASRNLNIGVTGSVDYQMAPSDNLLFYITSSTDWYLRRNLTWQTRTSWSYNRTLNTESFWLESSLSYTYGNFNAQVRFVENYFFGRSRSSIFLSVSRVLGSRYAQRP